MRQGISHVPEGREVFPLLTVKENLLMGAYCREDRDAVAEDMDVIYEYFPVLSNLDDQLAAYLSGGEQQRVAIARAIVS